MRVPKRITTWAAVLLVCAGSLAALSKTYDGDWWDSLSSAEQEGFIFGYGDCYADSADQRVRISIDDANMRIAVGVFYQAHQKLRTRPVPLVLRDIWSGHVNVAETRHVVAGEGWRQRHGYFDGLWWKGSNSAEQLGFVEGYAACHNTELRKAKPLTLEPEKYVSLLSGWYTPGGDDALVAQHQGAKIADVLQRFAEASGGASR